MRFAEPPTAAELARDVARRLERAGVPPAEAAMDAELLARAALGWDRARWITDSRTPAPATLRGAMEALVARRERREPMAYVLGHCEFWGLAFTVDPSVLIPRPETEIVVEQALARIPPDAELEVVDVGTGSGCIAVSIAIERPRARVIGTDISLPALEVARKNAARHGVAARVALQHTAGAASVHATDVIVSNPPYVPTRDRGTLAPEVRDYEPPEALFAGEDGLDVVRWLVWEAESALSRGGWLIFEFGFGQGDAVRALLEDDTWTDVAMVRDLQGIERTAIARRRG